MSLAEMKSLSHFVFWDI